jgi:DNA topoisomerase I
MAFRFRHLLGPAGHFRPAGEGKAVRSQLVSVDGRRIPAGKDFDPATGQDQGSQLLLLNEQPGPGAGRAAPRGQCRVSTWKTSPTPRALPAVHHQHAPAGSQPQATASPPGGHAGGPKPVRERAHHLHAYRLDQPGKVAIDAARDLVRPSTAASTCRPAARLSTKVKNAQEAHEAIRPAGHPFDLPDSLRSRARPRQFRCTT